MSAIETVLYDEGTGDQHFKLVERDGKLYETSNAVTDSLVCSAMFAGWGIESEPRRSEWIDELEEQFGDREIAERYYAAAIDADK